MTCTQIFVVLFLWLCIACPCSAHWADLAVAQINVKEQEVQITLTFPTGLLASLRHGQTNPVSSKEIIFHETEFQSFINGRLGLSDGAQTAVLRPIQLSATPPQGLGPTKSPHTTFLLKYDFPKRIRNLQIHYDLFLPGVTTASCLSTILKSGNLQTFVFTPENREFSTQSSSTWRQALSFVTLGIEHILTGYDHVLFLVSLLIVPAGIGYLFRVVTAFTVAHSITLSLAIFNIIAIPSRLVEPAIALTIAYVAFENLWRKTTNGRWAITFCFGLIHGLGFASVLKDLIPHSNVPLSLASFNIGVEIGQLAIVGVVYALVQTYKNRNFEPMIRRWVSASVVAVSLFWFIQRAFLA